MDKILQSAYVPDSYCSLIKVLRALHHPMTDVSYYCLQIYR